MKYVRPYKRWQKVALWLGEDPLGQAIWMVPAALLIFAPAYYFGLWWGALIVVAGVSFAAGWNAARRKFLREGFIDKL